MRRKGASRRGLGHAPELGLPWPALTDCPTRPAGKRRAHPIPPLTIDRRTGTTPHGGTGLELEPDLGVACGAPTPPLLGVDAAHETWPGELMKIDTNKQGEKKAIIVAMAAWLTGGTLYFSPSPRWTMP
ncbi:hypothetical protein NDU88_007254 [Pleurodeles waltl]|uniref:Uncharacterized protein n=1 Tax=Pleurodeles waltl TaxID=8319 RepID=A0AAV7N3J6_PLEWA|nr:hypothetical protein NDU88_007254 [Pleurodeles waltl]